MALGDFELLETLGVGQFGRVWKARDRRLDRIVAIKIPRKSHLSAAEMEQFLREARAAAQVHHPNIVAVHEVSMANDAVYIVSDFVSGVTLTAWLAVRRLTPVEAARLCVKLSRRLTRGPRGWRRPSRSQTGQHPSGHRGPTAHYGFRSRSP